MKILSIPNAACVGAAVDQVDSDRVRPYRFSVSCECPRLRSWLDTSDWLANTFSFVVKEEHTTEVQPDAREERLHEQIGWFGSIRTNDDMFKNMITNVITDTHIAGTDTGQDLW